MTAVQEWIFQLNLPTLLIVGTITLAAFYFGKTMKFIRLPSIIGFMVIGVLLGPSFLGLLNENLQQNLSFITAIALGFVALSIGLELSFSSLRRLGAGIILIILSESFAAFIFVFLGVYLLSGDLPLALILGSIAPASAPAGTVAVIQEYKAKGSLTQALYAVVGFDDGLGIVIFGFAAAIARSLIGQVGNVAAESWWMIVLPPLKEIGLSLLLGGLSGLLYSLMARKLSKRRDIFPLTFAMVLIATGLSIYIHLSLILTNLILGLVVINTQPRHLADRIKDELRSIMPLLFILFFVLAGANLHLSALPALGLLGLMYMLCRSAGLMGGAWLGAAVGRVERKIRRYLGLGILSQAGVAIGLALIVKQEFSGLGPWGARIGSTVITTVTATSIIFEIVGPILARIGLTKAGEIGRSTHHSSGQQEL